MRWNKVRRHFHFTRGEHVELVLNKWRSGGIKSGGRGRENCDRISRAAKPRNDLPSRSAAVNLVSEVLRFDRHYAVRFDKTFQLLWPRPGGIENRNCHR